MSRDGTFHVGDPRGEALHGRGIGLRLSYSQGVGRRGCRIGGHLVGHRHPRRTGPALWRVRIVGGIDPQILGQPISHSRGCRLNDHLALPARQRGGVLGGLLSSGDVLVGRDEARLQSGQGLALRGDGPFRVGHPGGQALHRRSICLGLGDRQGIRRCRSGIGGHLVSNRNPGRAVPAFGGVRIARGIDPEVLRQTISCGRRSRLHNDLALPSGQGIRRISGRLCSADVLVGRGQARLQAGDLLGLSGGGALQGLDLGFNRLHAHGQAIRGLHHFADVSPIGVIWRWIAGRHVALGLIQLAVLAQHALASGVRLAGLVGHRISEVSDVINLLLQIALCLVQGLRESVLGLDNGVIGIGDLLVQVTADLAQALVHRAGAVHVDKIDALGQLPAQLALSNLASNHLEHLCRVA